MQATAKRSRRLAVVAGISALAVAIAGATYAWFFAQNNTLSGSGNAAKISLEANDVTLNFENVLPGEKVDTSAFGLMYDGTRYGIMRISLSESGMAAQLKDDPTTHADWDTAYSPDDYVEDNGTWYYTNKRLNEIMKFEIGTGSAVTFYPNADGTAYYALVAPGDSGQDVLTTLNVKFSGEFGGHFSNGTTNVSPSRQFEQESEFNNLGLDASVVQCTEEAVQDVWGADVYADMLTVTDLINAITSTSDASISWDYVG